MRIAVTGLLAAVVLSAPLQAQGADVIVTGSRLSPAADASALELATLPANRLAARSSVGDALSEIADIYVQTPSGRSGQSAIFLRGADPNFTVVLLDGIALNNSANALGGAVNVGELPAGSFERVELVAGPASAVYGSGALAGVINLIVPAGTPDHQVDAQFTGGEGEAGGLLRWRGPVGAAYGASLGATIETESFGQSSFDAVTVLGKVATTDITAGRAGRIVFRLSDVRSRGFPDSSGGERLAVLRATERRAGREVVVGALQGFAVSDRLSLDVAASYLGRRDEIETPGVADSPFAPGGVPGGKDDTRYDRVTGQVTGRYATGATMTVAGGELLHEKARSVGALELFGQSLPTSFAAGRTTVSLFAESALHLSAVDVNLGGRVDRVDRLGTHVTGRAAGRLRLGDGPFAISAAAGTGFKAPSFYALSNPFVGNPQLRPEKSRSIEAAVHFDGPVALTIGAFHSRYRDLIDFVADPFPRLINRSAVRTEGFRAVAQTTQGPFAMSTSVNYTDTRDGGTGERLLNRPKWSGAATAAWTASDRLKLTARYRHTGDRLSFAVPTGVAVLRATNRLGIEAEWRPVTDLKILAIVDDVTDDRGEDAVGFVPRGRRARIRISKTL